MNLFTVISFIGPIALVLIMMLFNKYFAGWKTNVQGLLVAIVGGIPLMDLTFIEPAIASALTGGAGIAVLISSYLTKRVKE